MRTEFRQIIQAVTEALHSPVVESPVIIQPGGPATPALPIDAPVLTIEQMSGLLQFKERAILAGNFEEFMKLLEEATVAIGLSPAVDIPKVASVLNGYRLEAQKEPL